MIVPLRSISILIITKLILLSHAKHLLAESVHHFHFEQTNTDVINYGLSINPWFIERVHRALVKAEAFKRLKKSHQYYEDLLQKNSERIDNVLKASLSKDELLDYFCRTMSDFYATNDSPDKKEAFESFIRQKAVKTITELSKISPIDGSIYSFKQGAAIGDKIIIDSAFELNYTDHRYSLSDLKRFLEDYNGVKLYRGIYRIGFWVIRKVTGLSYNNLEQKANNGTVLTWAIL